jgi:alanine racemase
MTTPEYYISSITEIVGGELIRFFHDNHIARLSIDSRKIQDPETVLFFALRGPRHDGHHFIRDLYERGVRNFVVSKTTENIDLLFEANIIKVDDTKRALQDLAAHHRRSFSIPVVGITGSNGKTIVKEWLFQMLQGRFNIVRSPRSFNSQVGVPLSVWNMTSQHELGLFEAGISKPGEMQKLEKVIRPELGVFVNLREAHDAQFESRLQKATEKLLLFRNCETLIYSADYPEIKQAIDLAGWAAQLRLVSYSLSHPDATYITNEIHRESEHAEMWVSSESARVKLTVPFTDQGSLENALACYAAGKALGIEDSLLIPAIASLQPIQMRLQLLEGINQCGIINDAYNSDMGSLEIALDFANQQRFLRKKTLILSDILQSSTASPELYKAVAKICREKKISRVFGVGPEISAHASAFGDNDRFFETTEDFLNQFSPDWFEHELVVIKGARPFRFERISRLLQQKSHETVLEINLDALVHNLNYFRAGLNPETKMMVMVKAFSYGAGGQEVAHLLEYNKVAYLAVAYADEGVELRKAGVQIPIMVMNPESSGYHTMIRHRLEPEIYSFRSLKAFLEACRTMMVGSPYPVHIKLDSGMHRLGFVHSEVAELIRTLKEQPLIKVASVFSHLAAADNEVHDDFTHNQARKFIRMSRELQEELGYDIPRHLLNTSGMLRFPDYQFEMVRLGIGIYGYGGQGAHAGKLVPASRLKTVISQIKNLDPGETVGYQRSGRLEKAGQVATLPIGYADGYSRALGNGKGSFWINGFRAETVGNICMDMCMVNVTGIPCKEGDEVEVFGPNIPVEELARLMNTITYEVISGISRRVKRVYYHE